MTEAMRTPGKVRTLCRSGAFDGETAGAALGHIQANLVVLDRDLAFDFLVFCQRNPKPCPLLDVTDPGSPDPKVIAPGADIRTDLPRYRVYRHGEMVEETADILSYWRDDSVGFLIGCSFTFENAILAAGLPLRHHELGVGVPMYITNIDCVPAGRFAGPMVVSMRPFSKKDAVRAVEVTGRYPGGAWCPRSHRRSSRDRYSGSRSAGLWCAVAGPQRRSSGFLGLWRDASSGGNASQAGLDDYPRTRAHVRRR